MTWPTYVFATNNFTEVKVLTQNLILKENLFSSCRVNLSSAISGSKVIQCCRRCSLPVFEAEKLLTEILTLIHTFSWKRQANLPQDKSPIYSEYLLRCQ